MTDSKQNANGLGFQTQATVDENGNWYTLLTFQMGILSASIAVPVDSVPEFIRSFRSALSDGHRDTLLARSEAEGARLKVMENKLHLPGQN